MRLAFSGFPFMTVVRIVSALVLVSALAACSRPTETTEPVRAVKLMSVPVASPVQWPEYTAEVKARIEARLGFRVGGKLIRRHVEVGQRVRAGQLLAELDAADLGLASQAGQAQVGAAQSQRDLAASELKRALELKAQGFVSAVEIDRRQAQLNAAEATLKQARAQSAVQGNQARYARLLADADGVVLALEAEAGQVVAAGAPVVRLARDGAREVQFSVPEDKVQWVRAGQRAAVRLWSSQSSSTPTEPLAAVVREVAAVADPVTRTFAVRAALPAQAKVSLGSTAFVQMESSEGDALPALALPTSALWRNAEGTSVWVFDPASSTVQPRVIQVQGLSDNEVLVQQGLKPGDEVVVAGVHVLSAGQKVQRFTTNTPR
jgi:RND family efflux transporter MFP subunit